MGEVGDSAARQAGDQGRSMQRSRSSQALDTCVARQGACRSRSARCATWALPISSAGVLPDLAGKRSALTRRPGIDVAKPGQAVGPGGLRHRFLARPDRQEAPRIAAGPGTLAVVEVARKVVGRQRADRLDIDADRTVCRHGADDASFTMGDAEIDRQIERRPTVRGVVQGRQHGAAVTELPKPFAQQPAGNQRPVPRAGAGPARDLGPAGRQFVHPGSLECHRKHGVVGDQDGEGHGRSVWRAHDIIEGSAPRAISDYGTGTFGAGPRPGLRPRRQ